MATYEKTRIVFPPHQLIDLPIERKALHRDYCVLACSRTGTSMRCLSRNTVSRTVAPTS